MKRNALSKIILAIAASNLAHAISWVDLRDGKVKLPYNTRIHISGSVDQVKVWGKQLSEIMVVESLAGKYVVQGVETTIPAMPVQDGRWGMTIGPLPESETVDITLQFSGKLTQEKAAEIADKVWKSAEFQEAFSTLVATTENKGATETLSRIEVFNAALAEIIRRHLPQGITLSETRLPISLPLLNVQNSLSSWRNIVGLFRDDVQKKFQAMTPLDVVNEIRVLEEQKRQIEDLLKNGEKKELVSQVDQAAKRLAADWKNTVKVLQREVLASINLSSTVIDSVEVQELMKFAGFDVGAMYVPRLHEMRGFAMLSIYPTGPVSLTPEGGFKKLRDRWSLVFGMSTGDISGGDSAKTKIRGENAFLYGLGFRLNKFFRISLGGLLYRTGDIGGTPGDLSNKLRHEFFVGPSVDITALPGLRTIFASGTGKK